METQCYLNYLWMGYSLCSLSCQCLGPNCPYIRKYPCLCILARSMKEKGKYEGKGRTVREGGRREEGRMKREEGRLSLIHI